MTERSIEEVLEAGCAILMADPDNHEEGCCARGTCCYKDGLHPRIRWPEMLAGLDTAVLAKSVEFSMAEYRYDEPCTGACTCECEEWVDAFKAAIRAVLPPDPVPEARVEHTVHTRDRRFCCGKPSCCCTCPNNPDCGCWECSYPEHGMRMFVCSECGNKRCPKATDHRNSCTGSNDTHQPGSRYGGLTDE